MEIINTIHVKDLKIVESQTNTLNPVDTDIKKNKLWTIETRCIKKATRYKHYKLHQNYIHHMH